MALSCAHVVTGVFDRYSLTPHLPPRPRSVLRTQIREKLKGKDQIVQVDPFKRREE